jgi:hypothetical protein
MNDNTASRSNEALNIANVLQGFNPLPNTLSGSARFFTAGGSAALRVKGGSQGNEFHEYIISN